MELRNLSTYKRVRRLIIVLLLLLLAFTLAACGGGDDDSDGGNETPATQVEDSDAQSDDADEDPTATPTEEPEVDPTATDEPEVEPTATAEPETDVTDEPADVDTDAPAATGDIEIPEDAPTLIVGGSSPLQILSGTSMFSSVIHEVNNITLYAIGRNGDYLLVTDGTWLGWVNRFGGNRFKIEGDISTLPESDYQAE